MAHCTKGILIAEDILMEHPLLTELQKDLSFTVNTDGVWFFSIIEVWSVAGALGHQRASSRKEV